MEINRNPKVFGAYLKGLKFEIWFRYFFKAIEGKEFIREPLHDKIFDTFQAIYDQDPEYQYINLNLPPRSAKTVSTSYFIVYAIINNPNCEFIYTSFSAKLLYDVSESISNILNSDVFKIMYSLKNESTSSSVSYIDDFWKVHLKDLEKEQKQTFKSSLIKVASSRIHLVPIGGQLTGLGFGVRSGNEKYAGGLFVDDGNKVQDALSSQTLRERTCTYFTNVLLTRSNSPVANIANVQQRICLGDLTDFLEEKYGFISIKAPLVLNGVCQLPSQYDAKKIEMLKKTDDLFLAQYQQEPTALEGTLFNINWLDYQDVMPEDNMYEYRFVVVDNSYKDKEQNDFTAYVHCGVLNEKLYIIDLSIKKINAVDVLQDFAEWIAPLISGDNFRNLWIEDKGHGIYLNQHFRNKTNFIPDDKELKEVMNRTADKVARAKNSIVRINKDENKNVVINKNIDYNTLEEFEKQYTQFPNGKHDDVVDVLVDSIKIGLPIDSYLDNLLKIYG